MALSKEKFLRIFLDEFQENLLSAENQVVLLKGDKENTDALATLLRTLHTIKGSSRLLQFTNIEQLIHGTETVFKGVRDGRYSIDTLIVRFFFIVADHLRYASDSIKKGENDIIPELDLLLTACEKLSANEPFDLFTIKPIAKEEAEKTEVAKIEKPKAESETKEEPSHIVSKEPIHLQKPSLPETLAHSIKIESSIRVDSQTIDKSINLVNTLTIRQLRLRSASEQMDDFEKKLTQVYRSAHDLKTLRKELSNISRSIRLFKTQYEEQLFEIEHGTLELRDTIIGMRMLPLSVILERFPRMVEETASSLGKDVSLIISGDGVRVDSTVLAKLSDPLLHLVRNAIDHGVETGEERVKKGKSAKATIRIDCKTEGSRISVEVSDDGAGLDYAAIKAKAIKLWPENEADINQLSHEDLVPFLFKPGFSTKTNTSTISGRGVGLDIVKVNIESARGQVQLKSKPGEGSTFTLLLPVSASTMDGMFVLCSGKKYFIPAAAISRTLLVDASACFKVREKEMFTLEGVNIPLFELATGLQVEQTERKSNNLSVLLVRGPAETIGLVVEKILGYDSLVYQALPNGLKKNNLVQGIVFNTSFNIIPILNMWAILDTLRSVRVMDTRKRFTGALQQEKISILVADDSVSTREIEISMLELEGYSVVGAVDGLDALEKIRSSRFNLVVSDLNMPRMDGLKLLENIRSDEALANLPVIFVTTVDEGESRKRAEALGVNRYILKSSFEQDNLISAVKELVSGSGE